MFSEIEDDKADEDCSTSPTSLIERKTAPFDADAFKDHYTEALRDLIDRKTKSKIDQAGRDRRRCERRRRAATTSST